MRAEISRPSRYTWATAAPKREVVLHGLDARVVLRLFEFGLGLEEGDALVVFLFREVGLRLQERDGLVGVLAVGLRLGLDECDLFVVRGVFGIDLFAVRVGRV